MKPVEMVLVGQNIPIGMAQVIVGAVFGNIPVVAIGAANMMAAVTGLVLINHLERRRP